MTYVQWEFWEKHEKDSSSAPSIHEVYIILLKTLAAYASGETNGGKE